MPTEPLPDFLSAIFDQDVQVITRQPFALVSKLVGLVGVSPGAGEVRIRYDGQPALAVILSALRDANVAFTGGEHGWPPSAVFEELRDQGLLTGPYTLIGWTSPTEHFLRPGL